MKTISRFRGDTWPINIIIKDSVNRQVLNITTNTFILSVSAEREPTGTNYVYQVTGVITDGPNGKVSFPIGVAEADNLGTLFFDIEMIDAGEITTIKKGAINYKQDIGK